MSRCLNGVARSGVTQQDLALLHSAVRLLQIELRDQEIACKTSGEYGRGARGRCRCNTALDDYLLIFGLRHDPANESEQLQRERDMRSDCSSPCGSAAGQTTS